MQRWNPRTANSSLHSESQSLKLGESCLEKISPATHDSGSPPFQKMPVRFIVSSRLLSSGENHANGNQARSQGQELRPKFGERSRTGIFARRRESSDCFRSH